MPQEIRIVVNPRSKVLIGKEHKEVLFGSENVFYLEEGGSFMRIFKCEAIELHA